MRWLIKIFAVCKFNYSKMSLLRPLEIKTTSLFRPVVASPKWYFPYDIVFDIKTTSLIRPLLDCPNSGLKYRDFTTTSLTRPLLGSPNGGLNIGILISKIPLLRPPFGLAKSGLISEVVLISDIK